VPAIRAPLERVASAILGEATAKALWYRALDGGASLQYAADPRGRRSAARLQRLRDRHRNRRCFIIGNGPSLRDMDLSPLRDEITFGLNRVYLLFEKLGFDTTFLVSVNRLVVEQSGQEIMAAPVEEVFLAWSARDLVRSAENGERPILVRSHLRPGFSSDASKGIWEGATVTYVAMQLAYHMGIRDVILIGVDHSFATKGPPHQVVTSSAQDPNHFDPNYFGPGYRWQLPDLETSEFAYRLARHAFERDGRAIRDATVGGKLTVFPRVDFASLFGQPNRS
jgi:6-hydroxymethylpterin diphosphokinase MptE-like